MTVSGGFMEYIELMEYNGIKIGGAKWDFGFL